MLGGSADLTHSNLTLTKGQVSLAPQEFGGTYIRYGIREFGMSRGDERHRAARRLRPLRRHVPDLLRLRARRDPARRR